MLRPPRRARAGNHVDDMRILTVVGARPQFVKAAAVSRAIALRAGRIEERIVHTGQHFDREMSDVFFHEMGIPEPAYNLGIGGLSHGAMTGRMLERLERVMVDERPAAVLVYGDTNSTLAGAIAAAKLHVPIAHVEAGLRSFNRSMPEEINRVLTDHAADLLFAPTRTAVDNLLREGVPAESVHLVGDVMFDASLQFARVARTRSRALERLGLSRRRYILATIHRAENTDAPDRLAAILAALGESPLPVVCPIHPRTRQTVERLGLQAAANIRLIDPVGYLDMLILEQNAALIATDSGGVQKEAFFYRVPCVTLRTETEWTELVEAGVNRLAPPVSAREVSEAINVMLELPEDAFSGLEPYGDGHAAERIVSCLDSLA